MLKIRSSVLLCSLLASWSWALPVHSEGTTATWRAEPADTSRTLEGDAQWGPLGPRTRSRSEARPRTPDASQAAGSIRSAPDISCQARRGGLTADQSHLATSQMLADPNLVGADG